MSDMPFVYGTSICLHAVAVSITVAEAHLRVTLPNALSRLVGLSSGVSPVLRIVRLLRRGRVTQLYLSALSSALSRWLRYTGIARPPGYR